MSVIAQEWLAPLDREIASLMDDADRLTEGAFLERLHQAFLRVPQLMDAIDSNILAADLEDKMGGAIIAGLQRKPYKWTLER